MLPLLFFLKNQEPLGLDEQLAEGSVDDALRNAFTILTQTLSHPSNSSAPVFFSTDINELALGIDHDDKFEEQVSNLLGTPNAKICHMRLYSDETGRSHWHSLFAEMDEEGNLKKIILTDSRLILGRGITAQQDIDNNLFLKDQADKVEFIAGASQPSGIFICWIYCLANLASLATTGQVYQPKTTTLGKELATILEAATKASSLATEGDENIEPSEPLKVEQQAASSLPSSQVQSFTLFTPITPRTIPLEPTEEVIIPSLVNPVLDNPIMKQTNKSTSTLQWVGANSWLLSAGFLLVGGLALTPVFPLSLPVSITLISIGIVLALAGAVMLAIDYAAKKEPELEAVNKLNLAV